MNYDFETTSANTLGLYTTQVIDQLLDETNATVQQTSNDNSARFLITINTGGSGKFHHHHHLIFGEVDEQVN